MSLISDREKNMINSELSKLFDQFSRPETFVVYKSPTEKILFIDDEYVDAWGKSSELGDRSNYEEQKFSVKARIFYLDYEMQQRTGFLVGKEMENIKASRDLGEIKIQVRVSDEGSIKGCQKVFFDGTMWDLKSDVKKIGFFSFDYAVYVFKRRQ